MEGTSDHPSCIYNPLRLSICLIVLASPAANVRAQEQRPCMVETDEHADGSVERRTVFTFDEQGNILTVSIDLDADGVFDSVLGNMYEEDGRIVVEENHTGWVGNPTGYSQTRYVYDEDGNVSWTKVYDCTHSGDRLGFGSRRDFTYDEDGRVLVDESSDSRGPYARSIHTYDKDGRELTIVEDSEPLGVIDLRTINTYDEHGRLVTRYHGDYTCEYDNGYSCASEEVTTYGYDELGRLIEESLFDIEGNELSRRTFGYDDSGNRTREEEDENVDGVSDSTTTYTYDAAGHVLSESEDGNADGRPERVTTRTYDESGHLLTQAGPSLTFTYTYDAQGNRLTELRDSGPDCFWAFCRVLTVNTYDCTALELESPVTP